MAWRDSRGSRTHLLVSMAALTLGLAGVVAIQSFSDRLDDAIDLQTRTLLGADYTVRARQPFSPEMEDFLHTLPGTRVLETRFFSMVTFERTADTRLSQIRGLGGPFPFYGELRADPPEAADGIWDEPDAALVEDSLMVQFEADIGDPIRIGDRTFRIAGRVLSVSGEAPASSTFIGPRIYIARSAVPETGLLGEGSLSRAYAHFKVPPSVDPSALREQHRATLSDLRLELETAEQRKALMERSLTALYRYLNIGGLVALLLGGLGCAGSIHLYARKKREAIAVLRCLGTPTTVAVSIYWAQIMAIAFLGAIAGACLGGALQWVLPALLGDFLPLTVTPRWSWRYMGWSTLIGLGLSTAFAMFPLVTLRYVSPLKALRPSGLSNETPPLWRDPIRVGIGALLAAALLGFVMAHTDSGKQAVALLSGIGAAFALLLGLARLAVWTARRYMNPSWPFAWRQGLANIHRPQNQTTILLLALGLGAFVLTTLSLTQYNLIRHFERNDESRTAPNMILFNVQPDQIDDVSDLITEQGRSIMERTPIITMRLQSVNGRSVGDIRDDPATDIPQWVLFREYRVSYRVAPKARDRVIEGQWETYAPDEQALIPISIEEGLAEHLGIGLQDRLDFDLQGVRLSTVVRSIRRVDWREMRTNFFVLFPAGVLEEAPQSYAVVTRTPSAEGSARLQRAVINRYPNISVVDLRMVVQTIDDILGKAAFIIRFMAGFSVCTGLLVLGATVFASRYDRREELVLLRTLGASRAQLNRIMVAEYLILGGIASGAGVCLAMAASGIMVTWLFNMSYAVNPQPVLLIPLAITGATLLVGRITDHFTRDGCPNRS